MKRFKKAIRTLVWFVVFLAFTIAIPPATHLFFAGDSQLMSVMVYDSGQVHHHRTGSATVLELLSELGIHLRPLDRTNHATHAPIWDGMNLIIFRELVYGVRINGEVVTMDFVLPGTTVGQILYQHQRDNDVILVYGGGNYGRYVESGDMLEFFTWDSHFYTDIAIIPFDIIENHTGNVRQGRSHIRQEGVPGEHEVTSAVVIIGGEEQNRDIIGSNVTSYPVCEIIDIGTGRLGALADVNAEDFHAVRMVRMEATAYTAGFSCTGKHPCDPWYRITASGRRVEHGIVAVDRNVIPLGTWLYVEGYGIALAADVGGAIRGYKIDLFMECIQAARRFGRRHINVWILE